MLRNSVISNKQNRFSKRFQENMMDLFGISYILPDNFSYRAIRVSPEHVGRPDLIADILYDNPAYGDVICKINGISNPFELNEDDILIVPEFSDIDEFLMPADKEENIEDAAEEIRNNKPTFKKRKEKRAPNEAIIGDTRFKIDKTNRVIIY